MLSCHLIPASEPLADASLGEQRRQHPSQLAHPNLLVPGSSEVTLVDWST